MMWVCLRNGEYRRVCEINEMEGVDLGIYVRTLNEMKSNE